MINGLKSDFLSGWFDPWAFLFALRAKNIDLGVHYIHGDVVNMAHDVNKDRNYEDNPEDEAADEMKRITNLLKVKNHTCKLFLHL